MMVRKTVFQIRTKEDARYLASEIREHGYSFYYYVPLMGVSGGIMTIECPYGRRRCTLFSTGSGWQNQEGQAISDIVDYIWKERKLINAELKHPESEWFMKFQRVH